MGRDYERLDYLISAPFGSNASAPPDGITIRDLRLESPVSRLAYGGVFFRDATDLLLEDVVFEDFAWAGANLLNGRRVTIRRCQFRNAARVFDSRTSGSLLVDVLRESEIADCVFVTDVRSPRPSGDEFFPFDYKGYFHTDVRIHGCDFRGSPGNFNMEFPFENSYGVEVYDNRFDGTVSLPQGGAQADPRTRFPELGVAYSFWLHDNVFTNSYAIEGPRDFLRVSDNFSDVRNLGGRIYTQFGGTVSRRAKWFYDNVAVGIDLSLVLGGAALDSMFIYHNTFYYRNSTSTDDPGNRRFLLAAFGDTLSWRVENNVFVADAGQPREIGGPLDKGNFRNNVFVNVTGDIPPGNLTADPGLTLAGEQPAPFSEPATTASPVVDAGLVLPYGASRPYPEPRDFAGGAPDLGAYELRSPPLPVTFVSLDARPAGGARVRVTWSVAAAGVAGGRAGRVVVVDAGTGAALATVDYGAATAVAGARSSYAVEFDRPRERAAATLLLRVRGVDADGHEETSPVIAVGAAAGGTVGAGFAVAPNPFADRLTVEVPAAGEARLTDVLGRVAWCEWRGASGCRRGVACSRSETSPRVSTGLRSGTPAARPSSGGRPGGRPLTSRPSCRRRPGLPPRRLPATRSGDLRRRGRFWRRPPPRRASAASAFRCRSWRRGRCARPRSISRCGTGARPVAPEVTPRAVLA